MRQSRFISFVLASAPVLMWSVSNAGCKEAAPNDNPGQAGTAALPTAASGGVGGTAVAGSGGVAGTMMTAGVGAAGTQAPAGSGGSGAGGMSGSGGTGAGGSGGSGPDVAMGCSAPVANATAGNMCKGTAPPAIKLTMITAGLSAPTYVTQAPGDATRLYVLEQGGAIRVIKDGMLQPTPFMSVTVNAGSSFYSESGLLGMAFHPDFEANRRFYLNYSAGAGFDTKVFEYEMTDPDVVAASSGTELLSIPQLAFNHKGGMLAFGADGCLYIGMGDGGNENDTQGTGQGTDDELSVMLRVDVDNYPTAAPGNMTGNIWSTGVRNPWRFSFDRMTGDLYMGDVGQDSGTGFEEINVEPKGMGGRNYGWSVAEGSTVCRGTCTSMTVPAVEYPTASGANSVIGGYVYRGSAMPEMVGRYIWADWTERKIKTFIFAGETGGMPDVCDEFDTGVTVAQKVRSFGEDNAGEIYVLAGGTGTGIMGASPTVAGVLYKIEPM